MPLELLAAGCVPVMNDGDNNRMVIGENPDIVYTLDSPIELAHGLDDVVTDPDIEARAGASPRERKAPPGCLLRSSNASSYERPPHRTMTDIKATVFIPTYYGEDNLDELFTALHKQKVDFEYEILVIDTSSKDRTPEIIKSWEPRFQHFRYETITKPEFSHGRVRQQAAEKARGEYVVYLTQDATPAHDRWLYEIIQPLERFPQVVGVMGKQDPRATALPLLK
ncbi:MAG: glycosyltransferase family 2 protein, partial [Varibaculum sp.]